MNTKRKIILSFVLIAMTIILSVVGVYNWYNNNYYVTTDDARLAASFIKVIPSASGKLADFNVKQGDSVAQGQVLGHIDTGVTKVDEVNIVAPISGRIVESIANVGDFELSAQTPTLALIMDPSQIYIGANIEETKIGEIKTGQQVDIKIDQFSNETFEGEVQSIGQATNSVFSLLPSSSGTFTKVVQTVPIQISLERTDMQLIPGASASIKIHVK